MDSLKGLVSVDTKMNRKICPLGYQNGYLIRVAENRTQ